MAPWADEEAPLENNEITFTYHAIKDELSQS